MQVPTILVIDDDPDIRETLCEVLKEEGFAADCVENGVQALEHLHARPLPCMILLDLMMPVMDGWAFRAAQLKEPALAKIPLIAMTAGQPRGIDADVLPKPLDLERLLATVRARCEEADAPVTPAVPENGT